MAEYYPLGEKPSQTDMDQLGLLQLEGFARPQLALDGEPVHVPTMMERFRPGCLILLAKPTGENRPVCTGEWCLSFGTEKACKAGHGLAPDRSSGPILELVVVRAVAEVQIALHEVHKSG